MRLRNDTQSIRPEQKMRRWVPEEEKDVAPMEEKPKGPKVYGPKKSQPHRFEPRQRAVGGKPENYLVIALDGTLSASAIFLGMYKLVLKLIKEIYDGTYRRGWEYCIALAVMQENGTRFITFDNGGCFTKDFEEVKAALRGITFEGGSLNGCEPLNECLYDVLCMVKDEIPKEANVGMLILTDSMDEQGGPDFTGGNASELKAEDCPGFRYVYSFAYPGYYPRFKIVDKYPITGNALDAQVAYPAEVLANQEERERIASLMARSIICQFSN